MVKVGTKIRILHMPGVPQYEGREGTVLCIDGRGNLHGDWGGCSIHHGMDSYEVIGG